jgi:hypothetical protein
LNGLAVFAISWAPTEQSAVRMVIGIDAEQGGNDADQPLRR